MKNIVYLFGVISIFLFFSFTSKIECEYMSSNLGSANLQIDKALEKNDINQVKFYAYKAINTLEKSKKTLEKCGCSSANTSFNQSLSVLKLATKSNSLIEVKDFLGNSKKYITTSLNDITAFDKSPEIKANTIASNTALTTEISNYNPLHSKIDTSLEKYKRSINKVAETVDCYQAKEYAQEVIEECEKMLLKDDLSEGRKYFHLRTKEITTEAMHKIIDCSK